jgi:hypothetical protein
MPLLLVILSACNPLRFAVDGDVAVMTGELTRRAPNQLEQLLEEHPEVRWIELLDCPGSLDDHAALAASRLVREAGLNTRVPADGEIASGAVDFFIAGVVREVEAGGRVGVHSWSDGRREGGDVPRDRKAHDLYLDYYAEMGIDASFYWFTLDAASSDDIHWMTRDELTLYGLRTDAAAR